MLLETSAFGKLNTVFVSIPLLPFFKWQMGTFRGIWQLCTAGQSSVLGGHLGKSWVRWSKKVVDSSIEERLANKQERKFSKTEDLSSNIITWSLLTVACLIYAVKQ